MSEQPTSGRMPTRIPAAQVTATRWDMPTITDGVIVEAERIEREQREEGQAPDSLPEHVPASAVERGSFTAMELEEIAQAAHSEGYLSGKTEGYEAGIAAGRADGERIGREHGRNQAYEETHAELSAQIQRLRNLIDHLMLPVVEQQVGLEQALQHAVIAMVESIVGRELAVDSSHVTDLVNDVLSAMPYGARNIRLRVHSADLPHLESIRQAHPDWDISAEDGVGKGGCRLETQQSFADFSVSERIRSIVSQWDYQPGTPEQVMSELADELALGEPDEA